MHLKEPLITVSGLSHHLLGVETRESFALSPDAYPEAIRKVCERQYVKEAAVISTCNRTEILTAVDANESELEQLRSEEECLFERFSGIGRSQFSRTLYFLKGADAVRHLFRVAAGLDSLVVGEPQILGQLKSAYRVAHSAGSVHGVLGRLFERAFGVAKAVRTNTNIGRNAVSVAYASRKLAEQIFGELKDATLMLYGAGETGTLALRHFTAAGVKRCFVVNRTLARAEEVAGRFSAIPVSLENAGNFLESADIVIGASSLQPGEAFLVTHDAAQRQRKGRSRPQFFIDLAVPRNFDPNLAKLDECFLYNIDDLQSIVRENLDNRLIDLDRAELIVEEEVSKFSRWQDSRRFDPAIRGLWRKMESLRGLELEKSKRFLRRANLSADQEQVVLELFGSLSNSLITKTLHQPLTVLKDRAASNPSLLDSFRELFLSANDDVGESED